MVRSKKEVDFKKQFNKVVKSGIRSDKIVVVGLSDSKGSAIVSFIHKRSKKSDVNKAFKRLLNIIKNEEKLNMSTQFRASFFSVTIKAEEMVQFANKHRELRTVSAFKPYIVLSALTDLSQFKRGKGGKSPSAIQKHLWSEGAFLSLQEIETALAFLRDINVVVKTITGAWWPKVWLRDVMREQGISYLPTIK